VLLQTISKLQDNTLHCSRIFVKCLVEKHNLVLVFLQIVKGSQRKIFYLFGRIFVKYLVEKQICQRNIVPFNQTFDIYTATVQYLIENENVILLNKHLLHS
jgi:hypothetical protein